MDIYIYICIYMTNTCIVGGSHRNHLLKSQGMKSGCNMFQPRGPDVPFLLAADEQKVSLLFANKNS